MNNLSLRTPKIYYLILLITLSIACLSFYFPEFIQNYGVLISLILIGGIGIPHGATDHLIFYCIYQDYLNSKLRFYTFYIISVLLFGLCWYLSPVSALIGFIIISIYHLGQSNLSYLPLPNYRIIRALIYSIWGMFVIFAPIISNSTEVTAILKHILNKDLTIDSVEYKYFLFLIIIFNSIIISLLFLTSYITTKDLIRETLNLVVLGLLFYTTPLMLAFAIYFGLWHSLGSTFDQIQFINKYKFEFNLFNLYLKSIPLTLITISVLVVSYLLLLHFNPEFYQQNVIISLFFISLSAITLPHTIIRDKLYN